MIEHKEIPHLTYAELQTKAARLENLFYMAYDALADITGPMDNTAYAFWTSRHDDILRIVSVIKHSAEEHERHQAEQNDIP